MRSPVLSYRHPERSRGIFHVVAVLCTYEVMIKSPRCFGCSSSDALRLAVVQGRFLAALEMTIWGRRPCEGSAFLHDCCVAPWRRGAPKAEDRSAPKGQPSTWLDEKPCEIARLSYRHPERSRGIFYLVAVLCTYEVMIKSRGCFGCSSADALRLTVVQGRFLAALEMTIQGRRPCEGSAFLHASGVAP